MGLKNRYKNIKSYIAKYGFNTDFTLGGSRSVTRAGAPPTMRLRCTGPVEHRFQHADHVRCPMCQHPTIVIGNI